MVATHWTGRLALAALCLAFTATPAAAQNNDQQWTYCENQGNAFAADLQVGGCTSIIQSGRENQENLGTAFYNRGNAYLTLRDNVRAIADYSQAIRLNGRDADAYYNRGLAYERQE